MANAGVPDAAVYSCAGLSSNKIRDEGACALASTLEVNHVLTHLELGSARCGQSVLHLLHTVCLDNTPPCGWALMVRTEVGEYFDRKISEGVNFVFHIGAEIPPPPPNFFALSGPFLAPWVSS